MIYTIALKIVLSFKYPIHQSSFSFAQPALIIAVIKMRISTTTSIGIFDSLMFDELSGNLFYCYSLS